MDSKDLVNGNKEILLAEFHQLYRIHGRKWRSLLKKQSDWHGTDVGYHSWQNTLKGTVGNEALRLILADMNTVINAKPMKTLIGKQGLVRRKSLTLQDKPPAAHRAARKRKLT